MRVLSIQSLRSLGIYHTCFTCSRVDQRVQRLANEAMLKWLWTRLPCNVWLTRSQGPRSCSILNIALDFLLGSSVKIGTIQRRLAWPQRKDDTHKSRSVNNSEHCAHPFGWKRSRLAKLWKNGRFANKDLTNWDCSGRTSRGVAYMWEGFTPDKWYPDGVKPMSMQDLITKNGRAVSPRDPDLTIKQQTDNIHKQTNAYPLILLYYGIL